MKKFLLSLPLFMILLPGIALAQGGNGQGQNQDQNNQGQNGNGRQTSATEMTLLGVGSASILGAVAYILVRARSKARD